VRQGNGWFSNARVWGSRLLLALNGALVAVALWLIVRPGATTQAPWSGPDLAMLILAVATLMLAVVALLVAGLGIWGYTTIQKRVETIATEVATRAAQDATREAIRAQLEMTIGARPGTDLRDAFGAEGGQT